MILGCNFSYFDFFEMRIRFIVECFLDLRIYFGILFSVIESLVLFEGELIVILLRLGLRELIFGVTRKKRNKCRKSLFLLVGVVRVVSGL